MTSPVPVSKPFWSASYWPSSGSLRQWARACSSLESALRNVRSLGGQPSHRRRRRSVRRQLVAPLRGEIETRRVDALTIDSILGKANAKPPYLRKVDVQGAELDVLGAAAATLPDASLIVLEVSFFEFFDGGPEFTGVVERLAAAVFAVYDVLWLSYRPFDAHSVYAQPHQRAAQDA